jgi:ribosomal protein S6--L-glutamate ligase
MRFGVVTAWPREDWHSRRLARSLARRGEAALLDPGRLAGMVGDGPARAWAPGARGRDRSLRAFDALVLARGLSPHGDADVQLEVYRALEGAGAVVVNRIEPLLAAQDKFRTSWMLQREGIPTPAAALVQSRAGALTALVKLRRKAGGAVVMKPAAGSLGEGVERLEPGPRGRAALLYRIRWHGSAYLQAYVPGDGDLRLFVVGGRTASAIRRRGIFGEWRTNAALGGEVRAVRPGDSVCRLAERAAAVLGLDYAGVDLIEGPDGPTVIEVNGNPSWRAIYQATGEDMAEAIASHVVGLARARAGRTRRRGQKTRARRGAAHG